MTNPIESLLEEIRDLPEHVLARIKSEEEASQQEGGWDEVEELLEPSVMEAEAIDEVLPVDHPEQIERTIDDEWRKHLDEVREAGMPDEIEQDAEDEYEVHDDISRMVNEEFQLAQEEEEEYQRQRDKELDMPDTELDRPTDMDEALRHVNQEWELARKEEAALLDLEVDEREMAKMESENDFEDQGENAVAVLGEIRDLLSEIKEGQASGNLDSTPAIPPGGYDSPSVMRWNLMEETGGALPENQASPSMDPDSLGHPATRAIADSRPTWMPDRRPGEKG